ncbi:hypothetical protein A1Q1_05479 [Trichosporon asahii var. asahii CBS 2479]|uniref:Uncharacterized protein n=1 Tax=Trichosporon asahii var. asahii (strain ATCC 90039 / CBS 2479 / JCM 2466 / KCTC 7840 / NBRC 103889/ NCYC 2677 / UAMH 7654) TaxID=1186058 RepID=J6F5F4_TRIAS|nr:hypothetical protein A1Q1_05479 [Trichosporon asahii var. asahii CBS 2479]EJT52269.1 hypothetical protein A1Q1_05479 [Trichosporon asahii var. asahii CBS 2479]
MTLPVEQLAVRPYERKLSNAWWQLTTVHTPTGSSATYPSTPQSASTLRATSPSTPPSPSPSPSNFPLPPHGQPPPGAGAQATRSSFLLHLKRNSAADLLDSVEWVTDTFSSLRTQLRDRDAELALTRHYVAYLERVVEERDGRIRALEQQARRDARTIQKHREGLGIAWSAMMPREAQRGFQPGGRGKGSDGGDGGNGGQRRLKAQRSWNGLLARHREAGNVGQAL